ncbi:alpha/beta fold hydrolase [Streptomyces sp. Lzd4kr]|nr:alpha/beta fold hydrolase [Streptomyces sp. Lzd4kr]
MAPFYGQTLSWSNCDSRRPPDMPVDKWEEMMAGLECGMVTAPLDYRNPGGEKAHIAVTRLKAKNPAKRRGVLLVNPGGPGASGQLLPKGFADQRIAEIYDIIGFDPRGVGDSTPLALCEERTGKEISDSRPTDAQFSAIAEEAQQRELGCQKASGKVRPFISTPNTARDMDLIRAAAGEKRINYLGISYGTYLGAVYGSLFPSRLDRSVLDSSMHPDWFYYEAAKQQSVAAKQNFDAWAAWAGERDRTYHLGKSQAEVAAKLEAVAQLLQKRPIPWPGSDGWAEKIDRPLFDNLLGGMTGPRPTWDTVAVLVGRIRDAVSTSTPLSADAGKALARMKRIADEQMYGARAEDEKRLANGVFETVTCEADWPRDPETYNREMRRFRTTYHYGLGALAAAPSECTYRTFTPPEKLVHLERKGYRAGLVIQADYDPSTQYRGGPAMARQLRDHLVTVTDEGTHGQYGFNPCATKLTDAYLVDGRLPDGQHSLCAGAPRPDVPADGAPRSQVGSPGGGMSLDGRAKHLIEQYRLSRR